jgi:hypothetical protein
VIALPQELQVPLTEDDFVAALALVRGDDQTMTIFPWDSRCDTIRWSAYRGAALAFRSVKRYGVETVRQVCGVTRSHEPCGWKTRAICLRPAGWATDHEGEGPCKTHERRQSARIRSEVAWLMAHRFAQELNVTPWEGLLRAVRIAAGKVAYTEWVIGTATDDLELEGRFAKSENGLLIHPDTGELLGAGEMRNLSWWVDKNELWVDRLARYSKAAIDSGVAERLVAAERIKAETLAKILNGVLGSLENEIGLDELTLGSVRAVMRRELLALDAAERTSTVIEGSVQ